MLSSVFPETLPINPPEFFCSEAESYFRIISEEHITVFHFYLSQLSASDQKDLGGLMSRVFEYTEEDIQVRNICLYRSAARL